MSISDATWYRRVVIIAAGVAVVALAGFTAARLLGRPAEPSTTHVEAMSRFESPPIPDADNAARWLEAGAGAIVWSDAETEAIGTASKTSFREWPPELEAAVRATLVRHEGALATLHAALEAEDMSFGLRYSDGFDLELPELLPLLRAARLLLAEARVAFADSDQARGLKALATIGRLAIALEQERTLITALVGIAADRMVQVAAAEAVASPQPWASEGRFLAEVEEVTAGFGTQTMVERVAEAWSTMFCAYLEQGPRAFETKAGETIELAPDCRCSEIEDAAARVLELVDVPFGTGGDRFAALSEEGTCGSGTLDDLGGFAKAVGRAQSVDAERQLVRALVAMRRIGARDGAYPVGRPELEPLTTPEPFTGRLISYTRNPDGSLTLALVGAGELLAPITVAGMAKIVVPITLPAPGGGRESAGR